MQFPVGYSAEDYIAEICAAEWVIVPGDSVRVSSVINGRQVEVRHDDVKRLCDENNTKMRLFAGG